MLLNKWSHNVVVVFSFVDKANLHSFDASWLSVSGVWACVCVRFFGEKKGGGGGREENLSAMPIEYLPRESIDRSEQR